MSLQSFVFNDNPKTLRISGLKPRKSNSHEKVSNKSFIRVFGRDQIPVNPNGRRGNLLYKINKEQKKEVKEKFVIPELKLHHSTIIPTNHSDPIPNNCKIPKFPQMTIKLLTTRNTPTKAIAPFTIGHNSDICELEDMRSL